MRFRYETAIATLIQFITLGLLNIVSGSASIVSECHNNSDCVTNALSSLVFFLVIVAWFGFVAALGYTAQERRSKRLSQALIIAEVLIAMAALFNLKQHNYNNWLNILTSAVDLMLAIWVITLAYRLMRSGGGRIVASRPNQRRRRRPPAKPDAS